MAKLQKPQCVVSVPTAPVERKGYLYWVDGLPRNYYWNITSPQMSTAFHSIATWQIPSMAGRDAALTINQLVAGTLALGDVALPVDADGEVEPPTSIEEVIQEPVEEAAEEPTQSIPVTLAELEAFFDGIDEGTVQASDIRPMWERFKVSKEAIKEELSKLTLAKLKLYYRGYWPSGTKKASAVRLALGELENTFHPPGNRSFWMGEKMADVIEKKLDEWTDEVIQERAERIRERRESDQKFIDKALNNPETEAEFGYFIRIKGMDALSPEQKARVDALFTDKRRDKRQAERERKAAAEVVTLPEGVTLSDIIHTTHTRRNIPLFVVQISEKVEKDVYHRLNIRAKKLNGYYSSYRGNGAVPGFTFESEEEAKKFRSLEWIDGEERVATKLEERKANAIARIREQANNMMEEAEAELEYDRKDNTVRRARIAANMELRFREQLQLAETMLAIADGIENNEVQYLDFLITRSHFEQLETLLVQAHYERSRKEPGYKWDSPLSEGDIEYAKFPFPTFWRDHVASIIRHLKDKAGFQLLMKRINKLPHQNGMVRLTTTTHIDHMRELLDKAKKKSYLCRPIQSELDRVRDQLQEYDRLWRMNIVGNAELRTALREYWQWRGEQRQADPIKQLMRQIVGVKMKDFHPTPPDTALHLATQLDIQPGHQVADTSAGSGNLADAIAQVIDLNDIQLSLWEIRSELCEILDAKGYTEVHRANSLTITDRLFDRILINPPFSEGQAEDHVVFNYGLLAEGGRMIAIMSEATFTYEHVDMDEVPGASRYRKRFTDWLESVGGYSVKLDADTFLESDRPTATRCRYVVIDK